MSIASNLVTELQERKLVLQMVVGSSEISMMAFGYACRKTHPKMKLSDFHI